MTWLVIVAVGVGSFAFRLGPLLVVPAGHAERAWRPDDSRRGNGGNRRVDRRLARAERDRQRDGADDARRWPPAVVLAARGASMFRLLVCGGAIYAGSIIVMNLFAAMTDDATRGTRSHADDPHHTARSIRGHGRRRPGRGEQLDAPPRRRAREGARARARPAPAPRADHRPPVARRHDRRGRAEAAQGRALRAARHRRRRTRSCCAATTSCCCPDADVTVDVVAFEELARRALADEDVVAAPRGARAVRRRAAARRTGTRRGPRSVASSCGSAISTCCASTAAGTRWSSSTRATSSPTSRSCGATPRTAIGTPRCASSSAWTARCAASSASRPAARRWRCATGCSPSTTSSRAATTRSIGRDAELADRRAARSLDSAAGRSRTLIVSGPAGVGQVVAARARSRRGRSELGFRVGARHVGAGRRGVAVRAGRRGARRRVPAPSRRCSTACPTTTARRSTARSPAPRSRGRASSSHQRLFVAAAELVRLAVGHATGCCSPSTTCTTPTTPACASLHYIARSTRDQRVCIVLTHRPAPITDDAGRDAPEPDRPPRRDRDRARPARRRRHRRARAPPRRRTDGRADRPDRARSAAASRSRSTSSPGGPPNEPQWVQALDANMIGGIAPATREVLQRVAVVGSSFDTDEFVALVGPARGRGVRPSRRRARRAASSSRASAGLPVPARSRARRAPRGRAAAPPAPDPPRRGRPADRAAGVAGAHRPPPPRSRAPRPTRCRTCCARPRPRRPSARTATRWRSSTRCVRTPPGRTAATALSLRGDLLNAIGDPMAASAYREALDGAEPATSRAAARPAGAQRGDVGRPRDRRGRARRARDRRRRRRRRHPAGPRQVRVLHRPTSTARRRPATRRSGSCSRASATGRCSTSSRSRACSPTARAAGSTGCASSCGARARTPRSPTPSSTATSARPSTCCTGRRRTPRSSSVARDLQTTAQRSGALRAAAFASALIGEAALLSGDLELAARRADRGGRPAPRPRVAGGRGALAAAARRGARRRGRRRGGDAAAAAGAAAGAGVDHRQAPAASHLRHDDPRRVRSARGPGHRRPGRVDARLGRRLRRSARSCCRVPASIACVRAGDLENAPAPPRRSRSGRRCCGRARRGRPRIAEAQAAVARRRRATRRPRAERMQVAADQFERAGQPLDAERCRLAVADRTEPGVTAGRRLAATPDSGSALTRHVVRAQTLGQRGRGEQLERDVVGVAERQTRAVAGVDDARRGRCRARRAGRPTPRARRGWHSRTRCGRGRAGARRTARLLTRSGKPCSPSSVPPTRVDDVAERAGVLVEDGLDAEHLRVPGLAGLEVGHGHGDVRDGGHGGWVPRLSPWFVVVG